eukprot:gene22084-16525_t
MSGKLTNLLRVTHSACNALAPMVLGFYKSISGETAK